MWPPAGTARLTVPGAGLTVKTPSGETYSLDGVHVYNCAIMIQRDRDVYGDTADLFVPERWLNGADAHIPPSAWRAFERGPRNCIGQELALLEAKVVLALAARYDFEKASFYIASRKLYGSPKLILLSWQVGIGSLSLGDDRQPILDQAGHFKVTEEMYPVSFTKSSLDSQLYRNVLTGLAYLKTRQVTPKPVDGMMMRVYNVDPIA